VFVAGTVEESVCKNVQAKLNNLDLLNDGDLSYGKQKDEIISHHDNLFNMMIVMMDKVIQKLGGDSEIEQMFAIFKS
jgi:hypothetical protein